jgi:hypothetical protein
MPNAFAHWQAMSPTPPAAACHRMVSPAFGTISMRRNRYCTVRPCSIMLAPCSNEMPSGSFTRRSAGMTRFSEYEPSGPLA